MNGRIIITRDNIAGASRNIVPSYKRGFDDTFGSNANKTPSCSLISDEITTYVSNKVWDTNLQNFIYPPYVECEYVD